MHRMVTERLNRSLDVYESDQFSAQLTEALVRIPRLEVRSDYRELVSQISRYASKFPIGPNGFRVGNRDEVEIEFEIIDDRRLVLISLYV